MAQKQISRFPLNEKFSGLSGGSGHVPNYVESKPVCGRRISGLNHGTCKYCKAASAEAEAAVSATTEAVEAAKNIKKAKGHKFFLFSSVHRLGSVVEPFHYGPAPAPASQDGGSGFSSSSSPVVHNLLLKKKFFKNFNSQFAWACSI